MNDKVVPLFGGKAPPEKEGGSVEGLLEAILADLRSGKLQANKACVILLYESGPPENSYNVRQAGFGLKATEHIGLLEAAKSLWLKAMGF